MIVLGGVYHESVIEPFSENLVGSGLRAAASIAGAVRPTLATALDSTVADEVELLTDNLGINLDARHRSEPVKFHYTTPLSAPTITGPNSSLDAEESFHCVDDVVLAFGMIETAGPSRSQVSIEADLAVIDPQKPRDAEALNLASVEADRTVLVANTSEVFGLAGLRAKNSTNENAAFALISKLPVEAIFTKQGAMGCLISWRDGSEIRHERVGVHPTPRVWPIGSGDTFSAAATYALSVGAHPVEAARIGSAAAAHWCSTQSLQTPADILSGEFGRLHSITPSARPKIYLAGPFFSVAERWLVEEVLNALLGLGVYVWSPFHEVGSGGLEVAKQDLAGLLECDAVLALLDHADPGTVFEVGWAVREGIPVVGHAKVLDQEVTKMMAGTAVELHRDLSTACYRAAWAGLGLQPVPGWLS